MRLLIPLPLALSALFVPVHAAAQCQPTVLVPSVPLQIQWFGTVVRADGDRLLVSAPTEDQQTGTIYAFLRDPGTGLWVESQRIQSSIRIPGMQFGRRLEFDGDRFVASASRTGFQFNGAAFAFEFEPANQQWVERQVFTEPGSVNYSKHITLAGDLLAITDDPISTATAARVYFYRFDASTARFEDHGSIDSFETRYPDQFGSDVVLLDDRTALIGDASATDAMAEKAGLVRVVVRNPLTGDWSQTSTISSADPGDSNYFGANLAWDGQQLLVSEPKDDQFVSGGGMLIAYEFDSSGAFVPVQELGPDRPTPANTTFGRPIAYADGQVWVLSSDAGAIPPRSIVQRWLRDDLTGRWRRIGSLTDPLLAGVSDFGITGDVEGGTLFLGAPWSSISANPQGRAFAYDLEGCDLLGTRYCDPAPSTSAGTIPSLSAFGSNDVPDATLSLRVTGLPAGTTAVALGSQLATASMPAGSAGPLCLGGAIGRLAPPLVSSAAGSVNLHLDVDAIPTPTGTTAIVPGDTWHFQVWFRDVTGTTTSGFTSAARVTYF